jgi:predicted RNase H-like HicB family nuclease
MLMKITVSLKGAFRWDEQAQVFLSFCPALKIYSQGTSREDAVESLQETIMLYVETCLERGILESVLKEAGFSFASPELLTPTELCQEYIAVEKANFERVFDMDIPIHLVAAAQEMKNDAPRSYPASRV